MYQLRKKLKKYVVDDKSGNTEEGKSLAKSIQIQKIQQRLRDEDDNDEDVDLVEDNNF